MHRLKRYLTLFALIAALPLAAAAVAEEEVPAAYADDAIDTAATTTPALEAAGGEIAAALFDEPGNVAPEAEAPAALAEGASPSVAGTAGVAPALDVRTVPVAAQAVVGDAARAGHSTPELALNESPPNGTTAADEGTDADTIAAAGTAVHPALAIDTLGSHPDRQAITVPLADAVTLAEELETARVMKLLNGEIPPGSYQRLSWSATELFEGIPVSTPVLAVNGTLPGPTLCLTAAVHGDELNGIEMVRRVLHDLDPQELSGAVIGVPIVNLQGFRRGSRYLPDRRDLNRYFPGNPNGSAASRIAYSFFTEVIRHCDALIDLHTGSFERANLPQLRADLRNPDVVTLTHGFGATVILHSDPAEGTLRYAASRIGIPTVTLEAGGPSELELKEVMHGVKGIDTLLNTLGMVRKTRLWGDPEPVYYRSVWVRADRGGILLADVGLGSTVRRGDLLGTITDPMTNASTSLYAPFAGRIIGMARNQVVMPGFAAFHVGIQTPEASAADSGNDADASLLHDSEVTDDDYIDGMSE